MTAFWFLILAMPADRDLGSDIGCKGQISFQEHLGCNTNRWLFFTARAWLDSLPTQVINSCPNSESLQNDALLT